MVQNLHGRALDNIDECHLCFPMSVVILSRACEEYEIDPKIQPNIVSEHNARVTYFLPIRGRSTPATARESLQVAEYLLPSIDT
jgi:hypothetical protein